MHHRLLAAALALVLVALGAPRAMAQGGGDVTISDDTGFKPTLVTIDAGGTVTWKVDKKAALGHSVTSDDSSSEVFDSSPDCDPTPFNDNCLKPGDTFAHTFLTSGTFPYHDAANPDNLGEVIVLQLATTTSPPPSTTTTTGAPTTTPTSSTTTSSTTTSTSTTLVTTTTNVSSDIAAGAKGGGRSNAPLLAGAALVVAGLAGAAWWAYRRGNGGGPYDGPYDQPPYDGPYNEPPTTTGPQV